MENISAEKELQELRPDLEKISKLKARGLIVSAQGERCLIGGKARLYMVGVINSS